MSGKRKKQLRREYRAVHHGTSPTKSEFRAFKKHGALVSITRLAVTEHAPTVDARDKFNWAHGKMRRAGIYATRPRS